MTLYLSDTRMNELDRVKSRLRSDPRIWTDEGDRLRECIEAIKRHQHDTLYAQAQQRQGEAMERMGY